MNGTYIHYIEISKSLIQSFIYSIFAQIAYFFINFDGLTWFKTCILVVSIGLCLCTVVALLKLIYVFTKKQGA